MTDDRDVMCGAVTDDRDVMCGAVTDDRDVMCGAVTDDRDVMCGAVTDDRDVMCGAVTDDRDVMCGAVIDLRRHVRRGDGIVWSQGCAEPTPLLHALLDQAASIGALTGFCGLSLDERLVAGPHEGLALRSYGALGRLGALADRGLLEVVPVHYSSLPGLFDQHCLPGDVALVQVGPADADGLHGLGIGVDYIADALPHARTVIAEVNARMPVTAGGPRLPRSAFADVISTDRPLIEMAAPPIGDTERAVARHLADLVADGDTLQVGVGALPAAVLQQLHGHRDLGMHAGMIGDGVVDLIACGALTGARKPVDTGLVVTGTAIGTQRLFDALGDGAPVRFDPVSRTHAAAILARVGPLVAINGALEVDLTGQVNAEVAAGRLRGAVGGQGDFCRAAAAGDGRSVIALRATGRDGCSRVVARLDGGVVTTARSDVEFVVTEFGVADLRGRSLQQRAVAMVAIAAPEHRDALGRAAAVL